MNARTIHMTYFKMLKKTNGGAINQNSAAPIYPPSITLGRLWKIAVMSTALQINDIKTKSLDEMARTPLRNP